MSEPAKPLRVLIATNMYPITDAPWLGVFVREQVEALRAQGVEIDVAAHLGRVSRWNYLRGVFEIRRLLRSKKYDLIHSHHAYSTAVAWLGRWLALSRVPIIMTFHDGEVFRKPARRGFNVFQWLKFSRGLRAWALRRCRFVISVNRDLLPAVLNAEELARIPSRMIPAGIELARFEKLDRVAARRQLGHPEGKKVIFFPSDPRKPEKRFALAQAAVDLLPAQAGAIHFYTAGAIPYTEMPLHLIAADVVLVPSEYETGPLVVREAAACETAVVATRVGDVPAYADLPGVFVCAGEPAALAEGLQRALAAPRPYGGMARNRELGVDQAQIAARVLEVYRELLAPAAGA